MKHDRRLHVSKDRRTLPTPARLTTAIAACLAISALQPAAAQDRKHDEVHATITRVFEVSGQTDSGLQVPPLDSALSSLAGSHRSVDRISATATSTGNTKQSAPTVNTAKAGVIGDPDSWQTEEFEAYWGLYAIGAHHAYARGLTGAGIRLGVMDTGTLATHPEFADSGRLHPVQVTVEFEGSTPLTADGGIGRLLFGDHGTHTAGTIAASRNGQGMHGVAFAADLHAASGYALDSTSQLDLAGILDSINEYIGDPDNGYQEVGDLQELLSVDDLLALLPPQWVATPFESNLVAAGFDAMAEQGVRAISNSWAGSPELGARFDDYTPEGGDTIPGISTMYAQGRESNQVWYDAALRAVRDHDVLFVFAAGNESGIGDDTGTVTHASVEASLPAFIPELADNWVSVVAVDPDLSRSDFSNICGASKDWCIAAPGRDVTSTSFVPAGYEGDRLNIVAATLAEARLYGIPGDTPYEILETYRERIVANATAEQLAQIQARYSPVGIDLTQANVFTTALGETLGVLDTPQMPQSLYADKDGTSMATPHVTGALGLLFERFPYLTSTQVRDVMFTTATDLGEEGVDEIFGWGLLNLEMAINGPGQLLVDTVVNMNQAAGGTKVWEGNAWDDWSNQISGPGRLFKEGAGWLRLSGDNSFAGASVNAGTLEFNGDSALTGDVQVSGGVFLLNGSLQGSDLNVYENGHAIIEGTIAGGGTWVGGWLGGNGTLDSTTIAGTIAPGDAFESAIGTLRITGNYLQAAGSFYTVDLSSTGASDLIEVGGTATLEGGTVIPLRLQGHQYAPGHDYRILSAAGGVSGAFAGLDTTTWDMPFLAFDLVYSPFAVDLGVSRGASFASVADTWNQTSTGLALDSLGNTSPLLLPMLQLNTGEALDAFDQLSGELYSSLRSALVESGRMPREAMLRRARADTDGFAAQGHDSHSHGLWAEIHRSGGHVGGDGNARRIEHDSHAVLAGYDHRFDAGWRLGALLGTGRTDADLDLRGHKGDVDTLHAGLYGGGAWGGFGLRAGLLYARHEIDTERLVAFPGLSEQNRVRFDGDTRQAVVEAGYHFNRHAWEFEPFLQYAHVRVKHDAIDEFGGDAALSAPGTSSKVDLGTAGLRFNANLRGSRQDQNWLSLRGMVGYRHAGGDRTPETLLAFSGSDAFGVRGAPIADASVLVEAGVAARLTGSTLLEFGYSGQLADESRDHGANISLSVQF